jgi:hypothetical protein
MTKIAALIACTMQYQKSETEKDEKWSAEIEK